MAKDKTGRSAQTPKASKTKSSPLSRMPHERWTAEELLLRAHELDKWLFHESTQKPGLVDDIKKAEEKLAEADQMLALDPPGADATVGGCVAAGLSGPRRASAG